MASIKDIRRRISSVKNTQQITRAMKMVAASKLRRAQDAIAGARPFAEKIEKITQRVLLGVKKDDLFKVSPLLAAHTKKDNDQKLVVALLIITGDRGLCGAYNSTIIKHANRRIQELQKDPKVEVKAFFVGRRGYEAFKRKKLEGHYFDTFWAGKLSSSKASKLADDFAVRFSAGEFDILEACYTEFKSVMTQIPKTKQLLPLEITSQETTEASNASDSIEFIYKPSRESLLSELIPQQFKIQVYRVLADSLASELGAKMTAMDSATRNCSEMISELTLTANRMRQAAITKELMEIIGGAEALK